MSALAVPATQDLLDLSEAGCITSAEMLHRSAPPQVSEVTSSLLAAFGHRVITQIIQPLRSARSGEEFLRHIELLTLSSFTFDALLLFMDPKMAALVAKPRPVAQRGARDVERLAYDRLAATLQRSRRLAELLNGGSKAPGLDAKKLMESAPGFMANPTYLTSNRFLILVCAANSIARQALLNCEWDDTMARFALNTMDEAFLRFAEQALSGGSFSMDEVAKVMVADLDIDNGRKFDLVRSDETARRLRRS